MKHENFEDAISHERFSRYLDWAGNDREAAIELYGLNTRLSEALYTSLQTLEVVLRNRIHSVLADSRGEQWFDASMGLVVGPHQPEQVAKAIESIRKEGKVVTPGCVVSSLTFSFWTTMFNKDYEVLWQRVLHRIVGPGAPKGLRRKNFSGTLTRVRILRNRIAHHEPIIGWDLRGHHARMLEMIEWLSVPAADWCRSHDRFPHVHPGGRIVLAEHESREVGVGSGNVPPRQFRGPAALAPDVREGGSGEVLRPYFAQVSRRVTLRLNTGAVAVWSRRSATK